MKNKKKYIYIFRNDAHCIVTGANCTDGKETKKWQPNYYLALCFDSLWLILSLLLFISSGSLLNTG